MEQIASSKDQVLLFLILFSLLIGLFAVLIDKSNGLFLARNPFDPKRHESTAENESERKAGKLFVKWTYQVITILIPLCLLFYSNVVVKSLGIMCIVAVLAYRNTQK